MKKENLELKTSSDVGSANRLTLRARKLQGHGRAIHTLLRAKGLAQKVSPGGSHNVINYILMWWDSEIIFCTVGAQFYYAGKLNFAALKR